MDIAEIGIRMDTSTLKSGVNDLNKLSLAASNAEPKLNRFSQAAKGVSSIRFQTGNIAAQFQDIGVTAAAGMNPLVIALQQGTQLSAILQTMESPLRGIGAAFKQILNPISLLSIGFVALVAVLAQVINWTGVAKSILNAFADVLDFLAQNAVLAAKAITLVGLALTALYAPTILAFLTALVGGLMAVATQAVITGAAIVGAFLLANAPVIAFIATVVSLGAFIQEIFGVDLIKSLQDIANGVIKFFTTVISNLKNEFLALKALFNDEDASTYLSKIKNPYAEAINNETDYITEAGEAASDTLKSVSEKLRKYASGLGKDDGDKKKDPWEELVKGAERSIATMEAQQKAIGLSALEAGKLKYQTDLLNEAQQKNIDLTPAQIQKIDELSTQMAETAAQTQRLQKAYDFLSDAGKGFISDLRTSLDEGKTIWESFGSAVKNVIDKILDAIVDSQITKLMESLFKAPTGAAGGASSGSSILEGIAGFLGLAKGGVLDKGLVPFANGGAFTNSIVNKATPFTFANGSAFGVMGEAGPEAVMPLHRGPDGSLGVKMNNNNTSANDNPAPQQNVTYVINAPGASKADLESVRQTIMAFAGPGVTEQRIMLARSRGAPV